MFSGSFVAIAVLVVFASQDGSGQITTTSSSIATTSTPISTATPLLSSIPSSSSSSSPSSSSLSTSSNSTSAGASSQSSASLPTTSPPPPTTPSPPPTTPSPPPTTPSPPPATPPSSSEKTCLNLSMLIKQPWNNSYTEKTSPTFENFKSKINSEIEFLFNDTSKYSNLELSVMDLKGKDENINMMVKLCIKVKKDDADSSVIDVLITLNKNGKLYKWEVKKDSVTFKEIGVKLEDWEAADDECSKCSKGFGGPFVIKRNCESNPQSCNGLKTKESGECVKYCDSDSCAVAISSFTLIMAGIILSFSFNIWK